MESMKNYKLHSTLLLGAFVLGLAFRLVRLGVPALSDLEAGIALQALGVARGTESQFGPHVAYVGLTGFGFFIFSSVNFLARFWPAMIGALIVVVPFLFRDQIGAWPATILSFALAISPEMVGLSRIIGSPMMAFVFVLLTLGFFIHKKAVLSGSALALGLMSGRGFWIGVFILGLSYLISKWIFSFSSEFSIPSERKEGNYWTRLGLSFLATIIVVGTSFFLSSDSLSGIFSGFLSFIRGFFTPSLTPFVQKILTLFAYASGPIILGFWGSIRGVLDKSKVDLFLICWWIFGFIFFLIYPAGETADMIWVTLPLWILSARMAVSTLRIPETSRFIVVMTTILVVVIIAFLLLISRSFFNTNFGNRDILNTLIALIGGLILLVVIILLLSYGWSEKAAIPGLLLGLLIVFCAGMISVSVKSTGIAQDSSYEVFYPRDANLSPEWLSVTIDRVMDWNAVGVTPMAITVSDYDTPGMRWALRKYPAVHFVSYLPAQSESEILITNITEIPEISSGYRGQDLVWSREVSWQEMSLLDYLIWLITRAAPDLQNQIIVWVRTDLMPDDIFSN